MRENYTPKLRRDGRFRLLWRLFRPLWSGVGLGTEKNVRLSLFEVTVKVLIPLLFTGIAHAQIAIPYTETFAGISTANGFPTVTGGAWTRTASTTLQPTYITNQTTYNRQGNNDTKFMSFRYGNTTAAYYMVGPFNLTAGTSYTSSVLYRADGATGFGPLSLTYGTAATAAGQTNTIVSLAANITNTAYAKLSGAFTPATTGSYYLAIRCVSNSTPWYLSVDDFKLMVTPAACDTPSPALSLAISGTTDASVTGTITAPSTTPTGYLVVRSTSSSGLTSGPVNNTVYAVGASLGGGTVVASSSSTALNDTSVSQATQYYYYVYTYNYDATDISCSGPVYSTTAVSASTITCASAPSIVYPSNITSSSANLNWVSNTGATYTVEVYSDPSYSTLITSFSGLSSGQVALSGLTYNTAYYYRVKADTAGITCASYGTGSFTAKGSYTPLDVSGFNYDVIANGVGNANVTSNNAVDGADYAYISRDFKQTSSSSAVTYGLPVNRSLSSTSIPGLKFNLQSYSGNNTLRLQGYNTAGTITLSQPLKLSNVYLALTAGSGASTISAKVYFDDGTSDDAVAISVPDWYTVVASTGATPTIINGIGRVKRATSALESSSTAPNIHQITIPVSTTGQGKKVSYVVVTNTTSTASSTGNIPNIFAVSGQVISSCPNVGSVSAANASTSSVNFSWTLGNPGESSTAADVTYTLEVYTDSGYTTQAPGSPFTGLTGLSKTVPGLTLGTTYYYRVKAYNGICESDYALGSIALAYCTPTTTYTGSYYIYSFSTTGGYTNITNNSTNYVAAYNNYSSQTISKAAGQSFNYSVSVSAYAYNKIWVDWNGDLDFDDTNEFIATVGYGTSSPTVYTGTITIPAGTPEGSYRMRVRSAYYSSDSNTYGSCGNTNYGETEDYTVQVVTTPPSCVVPDAATASISGVTSNGLSVAITAPSTAPTGYLIIRSTSATLSSGPVDVTEYTVGSTIGGGTVVAVGTTTTIAQTALTDNTHYYYFVYSYNNGGATCLGPIYSTSAGNADATTCIGQSLVVGASNIRNNSATLNWTSVSGGGATTVAYNLDIYTDNTYTTLFASYPGLTVTKYGISGLTANAFYYYKVQAIASGSCSSAVSTGSFQATNSYTPIDVTSGGYNQDVIANGSGAAQYSTTAPVDATGAGNAYVALNYVSGAGVATTVGLPVNRFLASTTTSGLNFIVPDYSGNNCLRLAGQNDTGTLTFETPVKLTDVYIATTGGSGGLTASAEIIFDDGGASQLTTGIAIPDWVTGTGSVIVNNLGRANRNNTTGAVETIASKIFQIAIPVDAANQTRKVAAVKFTKTSTGATEPVFNIFAISGKIIGDCPTMGSTSVASTAADGANIIWALSAQGDGGAPTYTVEVYTDAAFTTAAASAVTGLTDTRYTITGLSSQTTYYYRVKATNSACESGYVTGTFTTSQIPATLNYTEGFEGASSWALVNAGQTNKWYVGTATSNSGTQSLYVSNDNGVTNGYDLSATSVVQAYRDIAIPAGTTTVEFSFDWKGYGESSYDYLRVWMVPTSFIPTAGTQTTAGSGKIQIAGDLLSQSTYTTYYTPTLDVSSFAGQNVRLVFEWRNDSSLGTQPSASIDNVHMGIPTCFTPSGLAAVTTLTTATLTWTAPGTAPSNGYQYYYSTTNTAPLAATSGTAVTSTTAGITGLTPNTTYYFWVRSVCDGSDTSAWISGGSFFTGYCTPTYTNCDSTHRINSVSVSEISFTDNLTTLTTCSTAATNRTAVTINVTAGNTYTVAAVTTGWIAAGLAVDFNSNANFADSGEVVATPTYIDGQTQTYNMTLVVPSTLTPGNYRLRVWNREANAGAGTNPCGSYSYGTYVDYTLVVAAPCFNWTGTASTEWNNTANWCGGIVPTSSSDVTITTASNNPVISTGTATVHNLTIAEGASLTVATGATLSVDNILSVNPAGTLTVADNGALVQGIATTVSANSGNVVFHKKGSSLYRSDYTMWSSPVAGQNLQAFSPATVTNRFYEYKTVTDVYASVTPNDHSFDTAKGYLIRMPNADATTGYNDGTTAIKFDGTFTGVPNNGTITRSLATTGNRYNAIGNPYPSPINLYDFFYANSAVIDASSGVYLWRKKNNAASSSYATLNLAAFVANPAEGGGSENNQFYVYDASTGSSNWLLAPGQGFIVRTLTGLTNPEVTFTNSMRRGTPGSTQSFFRQGADTASRLWINLASVSGGNASQTAIAYMDNATMGIDFGYDATKFTENNALSVYTLAQQNPLTIQARPVFTNSDVVPMGYNAPQAGTYTIAIDHANGVFQQGQTVYIKDNAEGIIRSLNDNSYSFATEAGTFDNRFEILYTTQVLGTDQPLDANTVAVFKQGSAIHVNAGSALVNGITIYDIRGTKVYSVDNVNNTEAVISNLTAEQQVLIVEVNTTKGKVSKRVIF